MATLEEVDYDKFAFLYPPRADNAIPSNLLETYRKRGWIAQVKKNGTNNVIFLPPKGQGDIIARMRKGEPHKQWNWTNNSRSIFEQMRTKGWNVFVAELLHNKTKFVSDTNYVHDILVYNGHYLLGTTYRYRTALLKAIFKQHITDEARDYFILNQNTWLAKSHESGFLKLWKVLSEASKRSKDAPVDEGLVLKDPNGILFAGERDNNGWTVKCRVFHKNFSY